jgi:hypothetical protein
VSVPGDSDYQMPLTEPLDDEAIEAIVAGAPVDARLTRFVALAESVRTLGDEPLPPPSPALEAVFAGERRYRWPAGGRARRGTVRLVAAKVAGLGLVAKAALGASTAGVAVVAAGASGALPDTFDQKVQGAIEAVTPIEFDDPGDSRDSGGPGREDGTEPGSFGDRVSRDATGESDGQPGVDGDEISDEAPGSEQRPDQPGSTGLDQADETPAGPNLPTEPGDRDDGGGPDDDDGDDSGNGDDGDDAGDPYDDPGDSDDDGQGNSGNTPGATAPGSTAPGATAPGRPPRDATTMNQPATSTDGASSAGPVPSSVP